MLLSSKKCCVPTCMDSKGMQKPLHLFPNPEKDKQRFDIWVCLIGGAITGLPNDNIYKYRRVCDAHFEVRFKCRSKKLSNIAVPTLNLPESTSLLNLTFHDKMPLHQIQYEMLRNLLSTSKDLDTDENACSTNPTHKENIGPCLLPRFTCGDETRLHEVHLAVSNLPDLEDSPNLEAYKNTPGTTSSIAPINISDPINVVQDEPFEETESVSEVIVDTKSYESNTIKKSKTVFSRAKLVTPLECQLYDTLVKVKNKLSKTSSRANKYKKSLKEGKTLSYKTACVKTMLNKLPTFAKMFTVMQFREIKKKGKGRRFSVEEKILALSILHQSPKCYRFLKKMFVLPTVQTLINFKPDINNQLLMELKSLQ